MTQTMRTMALAFGLLLVASHEAVGQEALLGRWFVNVNVGLQAPGRDLQEVGAVPLYGENLTFTGTREVGSAPVIEAGAGIHVSESFALGISYGRFSKKSDVPVTASVPHPLLVGQPRTVTAGIPDLARTENAVHIDAMWRFVLLEGVDFKLGAGPTFFSVSETGPNAVTATESGAPFQTVSLAFSNGKRKKNGVGFNIVGDLTYLVTERIGAGILLRYTGGSIELPMPGADRDDNGVGGFQFGLGLRLRF